MKECYTACSAIVTKGNKIAFKDTNGGLSLLGGYIDWQLDFPEGVIYRIADEHFIEFHPIAINGITQNQAPTGKWITNINVIGPVLRGEEKNVHWFTMEEALSREKEFRTKDISRLLCKTVEDSQIDLGFVVPTYKTKIRDGSVFSVDAAKLFASAETAHVDEGLLQKSQVVAGNVVRYSEGGQGLYALMRCGRSYGQNKLSFLGGALEEGESIQKGSEREMFEETGGRRIGYACGFVGAFVNYIGNAKDGRPQFITNVAPFVKAITKDIQIPDSLKEEVQEIIWLTPEQVYNTPREHFRTVDTKRAILMAEHKIQYGKKFIPMGYIETITE